jgi:Uma2 family endonuclease
MRVEDFEDLARRTPEAVRLEFVGGKPTERPGPDGDHGAIMMWLLRRCLEQRPELALYPGRGLRAGLDRGSRFRADGALAPRDHFAGHGMWSDPDGLLMAVEVTSHDPDTDRRDRREKRDGYAAVGIPVYLLVDRDTCTLTFYSEPENGSYRNRTSHPYGAVVELPDPVGITLETEKLKDYVR